jgi:hypothetical protein
MQHHGEIVLIDAPTGRFGLRVADGSYVLAEQLDARLLRIGASLSGELDSVGVETLTDTGTSEPTSVFILAYGLSREAVDQALN